MEGFFLFLLASVGKKHIIPTCPRKKKNGGVVGGGLVRTNLNKQELKERNCLVHLRASYCIIHKEALRGKILKLDDIMTAIIKPIIFTQARGLSHVTSISSSSFFGGGECRAW